MEVIHPYEVLSVAMEYTRILVRNIALSFSQLPGERVSWGMGFCWQLACTPEKSVIKVSGDNPELLKPVAVFHPIFNTYLVFHIN